MTELGLKGIVVDERNFIMTVKVGLIGYGYWGPNLVRNFMETANCELLYCCDKDILRLKEVRKRYPAIITTDNYDEMLRDPELNAIVIAVPTRLHYPFAKMALEAGKNILIEKPMTQTYREAVLLNALAARKNKILMVDHTFLFNEAVRQVKKIIDSGQIGDIIYIDSTRANLGLFQDDVNVIFDLASHDFSIIQYLLGIPPKTIQAFGKSHFNKQEDVSYLMAEYPNNVFAHIHVSWLSPLKVRRLLIVGTKKMIVYDDIDQADKIKIFDKGVSIHKDLNKELERMKISYRSGDAWLPNIKGTEALSVLAKEFIEAVSTGKTGESDGKAGAMVVNILEKATLSVRSGKKIFFNKR